MKRRYFYKEDQRDRKGKEQDVQKKQQVQSGWPKGQQKNPAEEGFSERVGASAAIAVLCMQIFFLCVRRTYQIEYITEWLPWLFFSVAALSVAGALCISLQKRLARLVCAGIGAGVLLLFLVLGNICVGEALCTENDCECFAGS